jgi:hypothetical protein
MTYAKNNIMENSLNELDKGFTEKESGSFYKRVEFY